MADAHRCRARMPHGCTWTSRRTCMVITAALWFDEPVDWGRVREVVRARSSIASRASASGSSRGAAALAGRTGRTIRTSTSTCTCTTSALPGAGRPGGAPGARRRPDRDAARPLEAALALPPRRRLRATGRRSSCASITASPTGSRSPGCCSRSPTKPTRDGRSRRERRRRPARAGRLRSSALRGPVGAASRPRAASLEAVVHEADRGCPPTPRSSRPGRHRARRRGALAQDAPARAPTCRPRSRASSGVARPGRLVGPRSRSTT